MLIANRRNAAAVGYAFDADEFVDVPDDEAAVLLSIKDAGFYAKGGEAPPVLPHQEPRRGGTAESPFPQDDDDTPKSVAKVHTEVDKTETLSEVDPAAAESTEKAEPSLKPRGRPRLSS